MYNIVLTMYDFRSGKVPQIVVSFKRIRITTVLTPLNDNSNLSPSDIIGIV